MNKDIKKEVINSLHKFIKLTGDNGVSDIDLRIRENISAAFMITVLEAIMDDNKEEIETSGDLKLIM